MEWLAPQNLLADPPATQNLPRWNFTPFFIKELPFCGLRLVPLQTSPLERPSHKGNPMINLLFALLRVLKIHMHTDQFLLKTKPLASCLLP